MTLVTLREYNAAFWRTKITAGKTFIKISDGQAIEESLNKENDADGVEYLVKSTKTFKSGPIEWLFIQLEKKGDEQLYVMVKMVNDDFEIRVYFEDPSFKQGNRHDMLDNEMFWLFQEPKNMEEFNENPRAYMNKLNYTMTLGRTENGKDLAFILKDQGEIYCKHKGSLVTIVEYKTDQECDNPELILLEEGDSGSDRTKKDDGSGGYITLLVGATINPEEIEVN